MRFSLLLCIRFYNESRIHRRKPHQDWITYTFFFRMIRTNSKLLTAPIRWNGLRKTQENTAIVKKLFPYFLLHFVFYCHYSCRCDRKWEEKRRKKNQTGKVELMADWIGSKGKTNWCAIAAAYFLPFRFIFVFSLQRR